MVGFERFKNYLDEKVETHFAKLRLCETQKLSRIAKAEKLKFAGNKGQFIFNSELSGTLGEVSNLYLLRNRKSRGEAC